MYFQENVCNKNNLKKKNYFCWKAIKQNNKLLDFPTSSCYVMNYK